MTIAVSSGRPLDETPCSAPRAGTGRTAPPANKAPAKMTRETERGRKPIPRMGGANNSSSRGKQYRSFTCHQAGRRQWSSAMLTMQISTAGEHPDFR
jgi:hypothetical protein